MKFPNVTPTPHNAAKVGDIAETVLIFGDPVRCKRSAEKYLKNLKEVSCVRGNYYYTGEYEGKKVTFGTSGMGKGSMGIYAYELFAFYGVKNLIRIGTSGAYSKKLDIGDGVLVGDSVDDSAYFAKAMCGEDVSVLRPNQELQDQLKKSAEKLGVKIQECSAHSTDVFYCAKSLPEMIAHIKTDCVEMESFALFAVAKRLGKKAACLLAITDTLYGGENRITPEARVLACDPLIETALNIL